MEEGPMILTFCTTPKAHGHAHHFQKKLKRHDKAARELKLEKQLQEKLDLAELCKHDSVQADTDLIYFIVLDDQSLKDDSVLVVGLCDDDGSTSHDSFRTHIDHAHTVFDGLDDCEFTFADFQQHLQQAHDGATGVFQGFPIEQDPEEGHDVESPYVIKRIRADFNPRAPA